MAEPAPGRTEALLTRLGFLDPAGAATALTGFWDPDRGRPVDDESGAVIAALSRTADPDRAAAALARLLACAPPELAARLRSALRDRGEVRSRLLNLLAASPALADHLALRPHHALVLVDLEPHAQAAARIAAAVGADPARPATGRTGAAATLTGFDAVMALRQAYRRELVAVAGLDMSGELGIRVITERLADLADAVLAAGLAIALAQQPADCAPAGLAVIAMGKTGGRELNYLSDVDVIFVAEMDSDAALATATRLAADTMRICGEAAWQVDAALRPEGNNGALVRSLASHEAYYRRWASTWEFQALLKARFAAGDPALGRAYEEMIAPFVWCAAQRSDFVADVQAMRRRVIAHVPVGIAEREIKLGEGGLRDVEFAVQLLQLVHGQGDETLRSGNTLKALDALRDGGYVGRDDALSLADAYTFLRATEHRLQLARLRRTHIVPEDPVELGRLARSMGYRSDNRGDPRAVWEAEWALHAREVRRLHEKLFYRPLLEAVARVPTDTLRLSPEQATRRLAAFGFGDPQAALRRIEALTAGLSRRAVLQRALLPVILSYLADAPDPDAGLQAYHRVSDRLGATPWYLRLLRDNGAVASRLARLLGTSRYVADLLVRAPEALQMLADDGQLVPRTPAQIVAGMTEGAARQTDPAAAVRAVRGVRRQELLRIAFGDLLGRLSVEEVCAAVSATTEATLAVALRVAMRGVEDIRFAVIAMGRLGGGEVGYGSDADVVFVYEPVEDPEPGRDLTLLANQVAARLRMLLTAPSASDPPLGVDADLRPEGRDGPLVRSLAAYRRYYQTWSSPWEAQALLRARYVAGHADLGARFVEMINPVRYPAAGLTAEQVAEIRRIKGRVDAERLPRGADATLHTKLGRGGLADIEWTTQLLQLQYGHAVEGLRTPRTLAALEAAALAGLIKGDDVAVLADAWRLATSVRNAIMLVRDKAGDQLPTQGSDVVGVGRALGRPADFAPQDLVAQYRETAQRAREVVERVFYED